MAIPDYPATYPRPETGNYGGAVDPGLAITGVRSPQANTVKTNNSPRYELSVTFAMTNDVYGDDWWPWVRANAYDWFNMEIVNPNTPVDITSPQRVRFITPLQYTKRGDNWLGVTVGLEMVPADVLPP